MERARERERRLSRGTGVGTERKSSRRRSRTTQGSIRGTWEKAQAGPSGTPKAFPFLSFSSLSELGSSPGAPSAKAEGLHLDTAMARSPFRELRPRRLLSALEGPGGGAQRGAAAAALRWDVPSRHRAWGICPRPPPSPSSVPARAARSESRRAGLGVRLRGRVGEWRLLRPDPTDPTDSTRTAPNPGPPAPLPLLTRAAARRKWRRRRK